MINDMFDELQMIDICFLCVKAYDLNNALDSIHNKIKDNWQKLQRNLK